MTITSFINRGNSFPVILEKNGKKFFVKLRAGMSGKYGLVTEWFGNKLGSQLNIKTQSPIWIELDEQVKIEEPNIEVKDLIAKSFGINIGFEFQEAAEEIKKRQLNLLNKKEVTDIFLFDLMMINIDRTPENMNLMKVGNEIISVDYESSQIFQALIGNKNLLNDPRILACLRSNPLYDEIEDEVIAEFISRFEKISIKDLIAEIPLNLFGERERILFLNGIADKQKNQWHLKETINKIKDLKTESKEDAKRRMKENQEKFKRRFE